MKNGAKMQLYKGHRTLPAENNTATPTNPSVTDKGTQPAYPRFVAQCTREMQLPNGAEKSKSTTKT